MIYPVMFLIGTLHARTLRRVVLPAPEAPIMAVTSPALKIPETLSKIFLSFPLQGAYTPTEASMEYTTFWQAMSIPGGNDELLCKLPALSMSLCC